MSLIIRQKKGALQLSINAIVVLILAITMLGLGLSFMRNMFGSTASQFEEISSELKNQMLDQIKAGNDKVILNKYEIEVGKSETKTNYFGIKNVDPSELEFKININCTDAISDLATAEGTVMERDNLEFKTFLNMKIEGGSVEVIPVNIVTKSGAILTTYSCRINVNKIYDVSGTPTEEFYGSKNFYVTIN